MLSREFRTHCKKKGTQTNNTTEVRELSKSLTISHIKFGFLFLLAPLVTHHTLIYRLQEGYM